jgi:CRISPR/Cas system endoribonuclease Cas6 (RAMP superfamily)
MPTESTRLDHLKELKEQMYSAIGAVIDEIGRLEANLEWERKALFEMASTGSQSETVSMREAAKLLHVSYSALSEGHKHGHLQCTYKTRIKPGGKVEYPKSAIARHRKNMIERKACGDCFKTSTPRS